MRTVLPVILLACTVAWSQTSSGSIRGTITDPSNAAVPNAKVTATDVDRNVEYPTSTDTSGRYIFPTLPPARYRLTATASGFETTSQAPFTLEVQQQATMDLTLRVGATSTSVEVTGQAPLLNVTSATLGQVVEQRLIQAIPNNDRNPLSLVNLAPGIVGDTGGTSFVSNGVRNNSAEVLMDGGSLTSMEQNGGVTDVKYTPTSDAIEEVKVQTNFFSSEFGNTGGTVINMVSKSGTNELHGVGYFYRRDAAMNANNYFSNMNNSPLADSHRNWLGGTMGGPVFIPKLYDGRNKTFFFFDTDYYNQLNAVTMTATMPTDLQKSGDFSNTRLADGTLVPIYNPYNLTTNANGQRVRVPLSGNVIPPSMLNPIAVNFAKFYPEPTSAGNPYTAANNFFAQGSRPSHDHKIDAKIDENISERQRFTSRYSVNWSDNGLANLFKNAAYSANPGTERAQNFMMDYTRTQNATTVINLRAGVLRVSSINDPQSMGFNATSLGLPAYVTANTGVNYFPQFSTGTYRALGTAGWQVMHRHEGTYDFQGSLTKIIGGHTIKTGAQYRSLYENYFQPSYPGGTYSFNRKQTGLNPLSSSSRQGDGLASALLGFGSGGAVTVDYPTANSSGYAGVYLNDEWRISRKLTLSLGVRWDADIPRVDRYNRINWMDLGAPAPIADNPQIKAVFPNLLGAMQFATPGNRTPYNGDWNNVQPRVGFAYAINDKTSIRGAYGIFYTASRHTIKGEVGSAFGMTDTGIPWSLDGGFTQYATFSNPYPAGITLPPGRNASGFLGMDAGTPLPHDINPQYQQWNLSIQRQVPGNGMVEVNYSASKGTHLYLGDNNDAFSQLNNLNPMYWSMGPDGLDSMVPNPFHGVITNPTATDFNQPTIMLNQLLRRFPAYGGVGGYRAAPNVGDSSYHSLQLKYEKRFDHGLSMVTHYTFSKFISDSDESGSDVDWEAVAGNLQNLFNLRQERSISGLGRAQVFVLSFSYQLPIGRSRAFGRNMHKVLDGAIGGWELSGTLSAQSGAPMQINNDSYTMWDGAVQRPNLIGNPCGSGSVPSRLNNYFNAGAFSTPDDFAFGSAPRYLSTCFGPAHFNQDASLVKRFNIREQKYVQLRLEAYSLSNHPQWDTPDTAYGSPSFGQITSAGGARSLQVALKFYY